MIILFNIYETFLLNLPFPTLDLKCHIIIKAPMRRMSHDVSPELASKSLQALEDRKEEIISELEDIVGKNLYLDIYFLILFYFFFKTGIIVPLFIKETHCRNSNLCVNLSDVKAHFIVGADCDSSFYEPFWALIILEEN